MTPNRKPAPRLRKLKKWEGFGYVLDQNPELTKEEALTIACEDLREAARLPTEIVENIGKHLGLAQHPFRDIEKAAVELIDFSGPGLPALITAMHAALNEAGCQGQDFGECDEQQGYCCVCVALAAYDEAVAQ